MAQLADEYQELYASAKGHKPPTKRGGGGGGGDDDDVRPGVHRLDDLDAGRVPGGAGTRREEMTADQKQTMMMISKQTEQQDHLLDELGSVVGRLGDLARGIQEEAQLQVRRACRYAFPCVRPMRLV